MNDWKYIEYDQPEAVGYRGWYEDSEGNCKGFRGLDGSEWLLIGDEIIAA